MSNRKYKFDSPDAHHKYLSRKPNVTIHKNTKATLSGISYRHLREILTAAALHNYDEQSKANHKIDCDCENCDWRNHQMRLIRSIEKEIEEEIRRTWQWEDPVVPLKERLIEVQKERRLIEKILEDALKIMRDKNNKST